HETAKTCGSRVTVFARFVCELENTPQVPDGGSAGMLLASRARHGRAATGRAALRQSRGLLRRDPRTAVDPVTEELRPSSPAAMPYQAQVEKHPARRGRWFSTENITGSGVDSPGRLITQALEATEHGRALAARLAPGTDLLMVSRLYAPSRVAHRHQDTERPRP